MPIAALVPLVLLAVAWVTYCLVDLSRSEVEHIPKWGWALVILLSVPVGGVVYLLIGRVER
ncbi:MAG: PLD nuclease N-terminal domain-containing protein [Thermoanaerobaculia bacterium]|nr:PLD nuclease N-terminal domain-containing protein [Thermoanaerobaculia bacterium]